MLSGAKNFNRSSRESFRGNSLRLFERWRSFAPLRMTLHGRIIHAGHGVIGATARVLWVLPRGHVGGHHQAIAFGDPGLREGLFFF